MRKNRSLDILIAEDNDLLALTLSKDLEERGHRPTVVKTLKDGLRVSLTHRFDIAFIDLDLDEKLAGFKLIPRLKENGSLCVILSAHDDEINITKGYENSCDDYLTKPLRSSSIDRVLSDFLSGGKVREFRKLIGEKFLTIDTETMKGLKEIEDSLSSDVPIFITGASGTGKTNLAKIIHEARFGNDKHFADFNASSVPENLIESELFGHKKGAFSGAVNDKKGIFEKADGGTLFIDEISTMSLRMQEKILKAVEDKSFYPVGSTLKVHINCKIISATCSNIFSDVATGKFRDDLYFRLSGVNIKLKALVERRCDVKLLLDHARKNLSNGRGIVLKAKAERKLLDYDWYGNTRELFRVWEGICNKKKPIITVEDLPLNIVKNINPFEVHSNVNLLTKKQMKLMDKGVSFPSLTDLLAKELIDYLFKEGLTKRQISFKTGIGQKKMSRLVSEMGLSS